ncbi:hypothetical protein AAG906_011076 [Vitis piasezkii]
MLWSQQVEEEEAQLLAKLHSSKPMHESSHMPNKMLTLYYDHSNPLIHQGYSRSSHFGSRTFKQLLFSSKQIVVAANPTPLSTKSRYWQNDLNQSLLVIEREFSLKPREIAAKAFQENFHYPSWSFLETGSVKIKHNDKFKNMGLAFSTCHIYKILTTSNGTFKTKWWDSLKMMHLLKPHKISSKSHTSLTNDDMSRFLLKSNITSHAHAAKTPQEFQRILDEGSSSFSQENSYAESDDSTSYLPDNGDDSRSMCLRFKQSVEIFSVKRVFWGFYHVGGSWTLFWRSSDSQDTVVNSEEINYPKVQNELDDWKLPKVSNQEIYKKGTFKFFTDYTIKTSEMTVSLEQDDQVIRLLDKVSVDKHKRNGYNFIHFGMVQVAAKPLTRLDQTRNNPASIITVFAYKSMNTSVGSGALCTILKSDFIIPKKILWKDFNIRRRRRTGLPNPSTLKQPQSFAYEPSRASSSSIPLEPLGKKKDPFRNPKNIKLIGSVYVENFEINKDLLRKDFYSEVNKQRNDWFFSTIPKVIRTIYQEEFYSYLRQEKKNIKFWIRLNSSNKRNIQIILCNDIRRIMEQINYTNMFLITLGNQVNRVEEIIETRDHLKKPFVKNDDKPLFKPLNYPKIPQALFGANGKKLIIKYKLSNAHICNQGICIKQTFILVKDLKEKVLLGVPFLSSIFPMWVDDQGIKTKLLDQEILFEFANPPGERSINTIKDQVIKAKQNHINLLKQEIALVRIEDQLEVKKTQDAIKSLKSKIIREVCSNIPNAFWHRKKHEIELPYEPNFSEKNIPTKARPIQMSKELLSYCEKEIQDLLDKKLIRKSKSPWSCSAFYVQKQAELERGTPRLVINYKPLNDVLRWIRYPIPNKKDLLQRLVKSKVFSKFDMKSGFWQIQITERDRYKTAFVVPFGHYEWNVMPFGLKNAPSEFQNIMNEIFNQFSDFIIVYIDDVLIYSDSVEQHWTHLNKILKNMAPKKDKQPLRPINSDDSYAAFSDHFEISDSSSMDTDSSSESLPLGRYETLERKLELVDFHKLMLKAQASFSPLENGENKHSTPLVNDKLSEEELGYRSDLRLLILEMAKS